MAIKTCNSILEQIRKMGIQNQASNSVGYIPRELLKVDPSRS